MKKKVISILLASCVAAGTLALAGCDNGGGSGDAGSDGAGSGEGDVHTSHTFDRQVTEDKYLKSEATPTEKARYYYSCECGETGTETFEYGEVLQATEGLKYTLNGEETEYAVTGIGTATDEADIVIPAVHNDLPVTAIGNFAFVSCESIESLYVPDSVKSIGEGAFSVCLNLEKLRLGDGVEDIGYNAFELCTSLKSFTFPSAMKKIKGTPEGDIFNDYYGLVYCHNLESIYIPSGIETVERGAICLGAYGGAYTVYCEAESKPEGWDEGWLDQVTDVQTAVWNYKHSNKNEGGYEYAKIDGINYALKDGTAIVRPQIKTVGGKVEFYLDDGEMQGTVKPADISIPKKVTYNGVEYDVTQISAYAFFACMAIREIKLPDTITEINNYTFNTNISLKNVTIPDNVKVIGDNAFGYCDKLVSIILPAGLTKIGDGAFFECVSLSEINCMGTKEQWLAVETGELWNDGTRDYIVHCIDGKLNKSGNEIE